MTLTRVWGKWCGPGWTANQSKPESTLTRKDRLVPCTDDLDCACKRHDIDIRDNGVSFRSDTNLMRDANKIVANPINLVKNPARYYAAVAIAEAMSLVRWTRGR